MSEHTEQAQALDDAQPKEGAMTSKVWQPMPEDVREAIIEVTNWVDDWTKDGDDGFDDLAAACHHIYRWLNAQPKGDG